ncbi:hypothetical protein AB1E18_003106 [Capra hircus]
MGSILFSGALLGHIYCRETSVGFALRETGAYAPIGTEEGGGGVGPRLSAGGRTFAGSKPASELHKLLCCGLQIRRSIWNSD